MKLTLLDLHFHEHPRPEDLLLYQSGELTAREMSEVEVHVAGCIACRGRMAGFDRTLEAVARASHAVPAPALSRRPAGLGLRLARGAVAAAAGVCLVSYLGIGTTSARVDAVLAQCEQRKPAAVHRPVRLRTRTAACTPGMTAARPASSGAEARTCAAVAAAFEEADWSPTEALSLAAYRQWRAALNKKRDRIEDRQGVLMLSTSTAQGVLRKATLWVRTSDYQATSGRFEFRDLEPVEAFEADEEPPAPVPAEPPRHVAEIRPPQAPPAPVESGSGADGLNEAEIRARLLLSSLDADANFETAVERTAGAVIVRGVVRDGERLQTINRALEALPLVRSQVVTNEEEARTQAPVPWMPQFGFSESPLAVKQLRKLFPDPAAAQQFSDSVLQSARNIASYARAYDELAAAVGRRKTGRDEPGGMVRLRAKQERLLGELSSLLDPVIGAIRNRRKTLGAPEAMELYRAVYSLIYLSAPGGAGLEETVALVRNLLEEPEP